ncbi:hypothetical protein BCV72DRAFT_100067 [Rhizopus microsporus var. microsporus]|uniref:Uncharacterized protein n=1 Tax=Rhizopus microsporus var. microsporus TaxID=86635 RepID=A0A1X0QLY4_RHIZD|nr:hypothetical protein BCV72DRAFT_100067 [Rhizopus microsporus var. microsporus]
MNCARKLIALTANRPEAEANILFGIAALIQKLPVRTMIEGTVQGEAELWSGIFDPILSSILSDPENDVLLRWSNVLPTEASSSSSNQVRPDAMVCEIDQLSWGKSLGFGEVKLADVTPNLNELGHDLLRLATLSKSALSKSGLHASMSFQIHGYRIKIYMSKLIPGTGITAMLEVLSLEFPKSVHQLDAFTTRRNFDNLVHLYDMFWNNCLSQQKAETVTTSNVLELSTLNAIRQSTRDRTRLNHLQY